jgi:uncharacterized protein DUF3606
LLIEKRFHLWHKFYSSFLNNYFMPDNKDLQGGQDRQRVAGDEAYEVSYLAEKLNVSAEEVRKAIEQVGNSREKVEEYLQKGRNS